MAFTRRSHCPCGSRGALLTATLCTVLPAIIALSATATATATATAGVESPSRKAHTLLQSRELWATVDVCGPKDQPSTIGIRGSMPGDGNAKDVMYMRFHVQYLDGANKWLDLSHGGDSGFVRVGSGGAARQAGRSFQFASTSAKSPFTLRGSVVFEWRRGTKALYSATRATTVGHTSLAGADPHGFSAATCKLG